ncbi:aromatic acid/H+ symport family MFS transporter [Pseudonocardia eucalypti]|uniref:Aromatic acid/H+ symport family MFS transporter n=1 Tax=Pseudonocardia eucalypti TaxID=648755 RepID=A0ABP9PX96_9PSEU|nr:AAHS family benzoate transporter-like MFS transporter [Pseudonocardia eucalypti]
MSGNRAGITVTVLCWVLVVFDGYDLIVYGTVVPALLHEPGWGLNPASAGLLGSLAFLGMLIGALLAGFLCDRLGRRATILACTVWFSLFTALCAVAEGPAAFGAFRLLAGIGLGGLVPSANALGAEFVAPRHRSVVATLMMSGVPIGGSAASLIGIAVLPGHGWRPMFWVALLAIVLVVPVCLRWLPESPAWLRTRGQVERAARIEARFGVVPADGPTPSAHPSALFRPPLLRPTVLFALATLATLFAWYGLGTWLPQLMRTAGFDLGPALAFLLALNLGAVVGSLLSAWGGVRFGPVPTAAVACLAAAAGLLVLITGPGTAISYLALLLAGVGTHGTQCLIIAAVATYYPAALRGGALGTALGIGRIGAVAAPQVGGLLLAAGLGVNANFLAFAAAAALAGAVLLFAPRGVAAASPGVRSEGVATP